MVVAYRRSQMERNVAFGAPDALLFTDTKGQPMRPTFLSKQFTELRKSLGLPTMRLYDLRHAHAQLLKAGGLDVHDVSKRMRHSRIATTSRYYLGASEANDQRCADVLDSIITLPKRGVSG
jgi:integrase